MEDIWDGMGWCMRTVFLDSFGSWAPWRALYVDFVAGIAVV